MKPARSRPHPGLTTAVPPAALDFPPPPSRHSSFRQRDAPSPPPLRSASPPARPPERRHSTGAITLSKSGDCSSLNGTHSRFAPSRPQAEPHRRHPGRISGARRRPPSLQAPCLRAARLTHGSAAPTGGQHPSTAPASGVEWRQGPTKEQAGRRGLSDT